MLAIVGLTGCLADADLNPAPACSDTPADAGDLVVALQDPSRGPYDWASAEDRAVWIEPVQGPRYPARYEEDPAREGLRTGAIPADGCVVFGGAAPGWYVVGAEGRPEGDHGCAFTPGNGAVVYVDGVAVNRTAFRPTLACPS